MMNHRKDANEARKNFGLISGYPLRPCGEKQESLIFQRFLRNFCIGAFARETTTLTDGSSYIMRTVFQRASHEYR
jgi:hypothetical protein